MRALSAFTLLALGLTLAGCNATGPAGDQLYQPPAGPTGAHIKGSMTQDPGFFAPRHVAYVLMVNGKFVNEAESNWAQALALPPGPQELAVEYRSSVFRSRAVFSLEAQAGATYVLRMTTGVEPGNDRRFCEFVIVDEATGQPVTPVKHTYATSTSSGNKSNFRPLD